jgi:GNAT superfamily N-acetyltransferase
VDADRLAVWQRRLADPSPRALTLTARSAGRLMGFVHVELDEEPVWGARLANLHVRPDLKGLGAGTGLFSAAREWISGVEPTWRMHLWVLEENTAARQFYERRGGQPAERQTIEILSGVWVPEVRYVWPAVVR